MSGESKTAGRRLTLPYQPPMDNRQPITMRLSMNVSLVLPNESGWVNARDLHAFLGIKTKFADWAHRNLLNTRAIKGNDYEVFQSIEQNSGRPRIEYKISLFMAEHFAMMSSSEKGHQLRNAYIDCRKRMYAARDRIAQLEAALAVATAPKQKRLSDGRAMETITNIIETRDIFGNVTIEKRIERKYRDEMTETERRLATLQHCARVQEGLSKRLKDEACGENVVPFRKRQ